MEHELGLGKSVMDFFKGETILILRKEYTGQVDSGNNPIAEHTAIEIHDVLVSIKNATVARSIEEPLRFERTAHIQLKPSVETREDDIFVIRGEQWAQEGLEVYPEPSGFKGSKGFLVNRRKSLTLTQTKGNIDHG